MTKEEKTQLLDFIKSFEQVISESLEDKDILKQPYKALNGLLLNCNSASINLLKYNGDD